MIDVRMLKPAAGVVPGGRLSKNRFFTSEKSLARIEPLPSTSWDGVYCEAPAGPGTTADWKNFFFTSE